MLGVMCLVALLQLVPEHTTPTETSVPTATKRLNTSH